MANLKGGNFEKQIRDANFRLAAFGEKRNGANSHQTHSDATRVKRDRYLNDFKKYAQDQELEGKLNKLMNEANLTKFFDERLNGLSYSTQEDYLRGWSGLIQGLQDSNISINMNTSYFNESVESYKESAIESGQIFAGPKLIRSDYHPIEVINTLSSPMDTIAQLQYETGYRVSEAYEVITNLEKHLDELRLHSVIGKGGQEYIEKIISIELKIMLLKLEPEQMKIPHQTTYYRHLQVYNMSPHDLRAYYAKELYEEKIEEGLNHKEACEYVSNEINHHRIEITEYYLAKFGGY